MKRKVNVFVTIFIIALVAVLLAPITAAAKRGGDGGRGDGPVIYVTGQDLYYDSIVTADPLPPNGPFQKLEMGENGLQTEYGPGDPGYVGGRWWMDTNNNGEMDPDDHYFLCPLLGPGRETP